MPEGESAIMDQRVLGQFEHEPFGRQAAIRQDHSHRLD